MPPAEPREPVPFLPASLPLKESPQRWWLAALLTLGMIFCYAQRGTLSVAAPFMMKERSLSPTSMGILLSAFFWSYSFMQVPAGWLVDRFGVKRAYGAGFAFWSLAAAGTGFARRLADLIALRVALGVGQAVAFPASASAVAHSFPDEQRGVVTAFYLSGVRLGQALLGAIGAMEAGRVVHRQPRAAPAPQRARDLPRFLRLRLRLVRLRQLAAGLSRHRAEVHPCRDGLLQLRAVRGDDIADRTHSFALALSITGVVLVAGVLSYVLLISQRVEMTETIPAQ